MSTNPTDLKDVNDTRLARLNLDARQELYSCFPEAFTKDSEDTIDDCIFYAGILGDVNKIEMLAKHLPDLIVNPLPDRFGGKTPLQHILEINGDIKIEHVHAVIKLIELGADSDCTDYFGMTPLMFVVAHGELEDVQKLLDLYGDKGLEDHKYYLNAQDRQGLTALYYAAERNRSDIVRALLGDEADPGLADKNGHTPLCFAADHGFTDVVKELLSEPDFLTYDQHGNVVDQADVIKHINSQQPLRAIFCAMEEQHQDVVNIMNKMGISLDPESYKELKSLIEYAQEDDYKKVAIMMKKGLDISPLAYSDQELIKSVLSQALSQKTSPTQPPLNSKPIKRVLSFAYKQPRDQESKINKVRPSPPKHPPPRLR